MSCGQQNSQATLHHNILYQLSGLIMVMNKSSRYIFTNIYTARMLGFDNEDEMLGLDAYAIKCPVVLLADELIAQNQTVIKSENELSILDIHTYADGKTRILLTKKSPFIQNNQIVGSISHSIEIESNELQQACAALIKTDNKYYTNNQGSNRSYIVGGKLTNDKLSAREKDCMFYLLRGYTMKLIAEAMFISPRTVESHIENIKNKLQCYSKSQIIQYAWSEGYLNYIPKSTLRTNISHRLYTSNSKKEAIDLL